MSMPFGFVKTNTDKLLAEPNCFFQGHDGPAYDVKFYGDGEDALLLRFNLVLIPLSGSSSYSISRSKWKLRRMQNASYSH